jgi:hypothetical protein
MPALTSSLVAEPAFAGPAHIVAEWLVITLPLGTPAWIVGLAGAATYLLLGYLTVKLVWRLIPMLAMALVSTGNGVWAVHNLIDWWTARARLGIKRIIRTILVWLLDRLSK